ncbi:MAG: hypothetical protein KDD04_05420 [Sinomicrobium sp.]|nr:hypothetical protein [Sinomicrobium sp.]
MKHLTIVLLFFISMAVSGQKAIYQSETFESLSKNHKTLAIIPFLATLKLDDDKSFSKEQFEALQEQEGYAVQDALETYFLKRKKKKRFSVEFQDIKNTNAILARNNITIKNVDIYTTKELCSMLGVDGLIGGNLTLRALISKGVPEESFGILSLFRKSDYGRIAIKISDGNTGKLLWKYEKTITRRSGKNTRVIIDAMMRKLARKFPYDREKR